ncbi:RNA polymerase sigma factor (sigma-70 family) [Rhodothalassium salexigens DSM 2132]|uniref:RNA polymerase sigma factor (Sigma-70 family) n=1 Tax=Rhodothalassium salexigens DSM 2132 TaxID=1188247 RepID=A0A4R2PDW5_RHOSA|nr:sigma-70 region 4 domain-containing protein [Rhodothalassium salexigens]MBB4212014.1 DNA-directed RNA polymerase specialized sigma24 family protein [Rhodothalassium salexigens DSM 2132]MBK1638500.1 hypothetical protein [Rhodothalassium salexigens DSM 2132]TCP33402.1 RNA polymerase sigma factor (sigma-70 family) [Rhodothalassium salexigens DSM 2132]
MTRKHGDDGPPGQEPGALTGTADGRAGAGVPAETPIRRAGSSASVPLSPSQRACLARAIEGLPRRARAAFLLHRFDGLSYGEVARRLNTSPAKVERDVARGLDACRRALTPLPPAPRSTMPRSAMGV